MRSAGTTPRGASTEEEAAKWVQTMFAEVAPRYDLLNHVLSFGIDRSWRRALTEVMRPALERADARVLDLCCGTGDVLLDLQAVSANRVMGADFCHPMLVTAGAKAQRKGFQARLFEGDAMQMPLRDGSLHAISVAFGFRNLVDYTAALLELRRVLRPGGILAILEFSHPRSAFLRAAYSFYSHLVLPTVGAAVSGSREAYSYLPESIRKFPKADRLQEMMREAGFERTGYDLLTGGIAALHYGRAF